MKRFHLPVQLHARLLIVLLTTLIIPTVWIASVTVSLVRENSVHAQAGLYAGVLESIMQEVLEEEAHYRDSITRLSRHPLLVSKLHVYSTYWNSISEETRASDILVLRGELERVLRTEHIDTIAVYRFEYNKFRPVIMLGNSTNTPDIVYPGTLGEAPPEAEYTWIQDGACMSFSAPVMSADRPAGLILFQKNYDSGFFEALSLRHDAGLVLFLQGLVRFSSLPGFRSGTAHGESAGESGESPVPGPIAGQESMMDSSGIFSGIRTANGRQYLYAGSAFDLGERARGYLLAGGPVAFGLQYWWEVFSRLLAIPLLSMLIAGGVFYLWGNEILGHIRELLTAADRIGRGEYAVDLPTGRRDEFGRLFDGIRKMAAALGDNERRLRENSGKLIQAEKMAAVGQFSACVAHEINNPLGVMLNHVQLVRSGRLSPAEEREFLGRVECEIRRVHRLLDTLLHDPAPGAAPRERIPLAPLVRDVAELFNPKLMVRNVKLALDPPAGDWTVMGSRDSLKQVLFNILQNAVQAIQRPDGLIRIDSSAEAGWYRIRISDNGRGMDETTRQKIFSPFFTQRAGSGTGLGLYLSRRIMRLHGGEAEVESSSPDGTTVVLLFPAHDWNGGNSDV